MKKNINTIISILITLSLIFNFSSSVAALDDNTNTSNTIITDELGNPYLISTYETDSTRTTTLSDLNGNVLLSLVYVFDTGILYNPNNGATIHIPSPDFVLTPCSILSDNDYEYEFCSLGDNYTREYSITANEIVGMIAAPAVTVAAIQTVLVAIATGVTPSATVRKLIKDFASAIFTRIDLGDLNFTAYYELQYFCTEIYESDPSYPNGGFWFLGYVVSNNYYSGRIGS